MPDAVVLLSGGQDSTTCLLWALDEHQGFGEVHAVSFDYGQRHRVELDQAAVIVDEVRAHYGVALPHITLPVPALHALAGAALTSHAIPVQEQATAPAGNAYAAARGLPSTFVPGRNTILIGTAAAYAAQMDAPNLVTGICEMDRAGYPDCRAEFARALEGTLRLGLDWPELQLHAPLLSRTKADTWALCADAGGEWGLELVRDMTHTCYEGDRNQWHPWGFGCGECPACRTRAEGWAGYLELTPL